MPALIVEQRALLYPVASMMSASFTVPAWARCARGKWRVNVRPEGGFPLFESTLAGGDGPPRLWRTAAV